MKAASLKAIRIVRSCLVGLAAALAMVEVLLSWLMVGGFQYGWFTIWLVPAILLLMAWEQLLQRSGRKIDACWTVLTIGAAVHTLLAMVWHPGHLHNEEGLCAACGLERFAWYVLPWILLSIWKLHEARRNRDVVYGYIALGCFAAVCIFRMFFANVGSVSLFYRASILQGATYGFLLGGLVLLAVAFVREMKNTLGW